MAASVQAPRQRVSTHSLRETVQQQRRLQQKRVTLQQQAGHARTHTSRHSRQSAAQLSGGITCTAPSRVPAARPRIRTPSLYSLAVFSRSAAWQYWFGATLIVLPRHDPCLPASRLSAINVKLTQGWQNAILRTCSLFAKRSDTFSIMSYI